MSHPEGFVERGFVTVDGFGVCLRVALRTPPIHHTTFLQILEHLTTVFLVLNFEPGLLKRRLVMQSGIWSFLLLVFLLLTLLLLFLRINSCAPFSLQLLPIVFFFETLPYLRLFCRLCLWLLYFTMHFSTR